MKTKLSNVRFGHYMDRQPDMNNAEFSQWITILFN